MEDDDKNCNNGTGRNRRNRGTNGDNNGSEEPGRRSDQLASIDRRIRELQARRQRLVFLDRERERKRDRQRRIILGGGLLAKARNGDPAARSLIEGIRGGLTRESDRKAFEGWESPGSSQAQVPGSGSP